MRWAIILLILLGVLAATSAALLVASYGGSQKREPVNVDILVATKALPAQSVINDDMVALKTVTKKEAPAKYYTNAVQVVGKMLIVPVAEGQVLTAESFGDRENAAKFAAAIADGMVAVPITLKDFSSLEGLLYPGCLVDVIFTLRAGTGQDPVSVTLLQGVNVLAIGQYSVVSPKHEAESLAAQPGENKKVTLQLTPRQAKALQLAQENGTVSLALRSPLTPAAADSGAMSLDDLIKRKSPVAAFVPPPTTNEAPLAEELPPGWDVLMIQGGKKETLTVPMPEPK